jgi:uncharacterized protein
MIVPDVNLLLYAYDKSSLHHEKAHAWWEASLSGVEPVGLSWLVIVGFARLATSSKVFAAPLATSVALGAVRSWFERPHVQVLEPGPRHLEIFESLAQDLPALGALATDAHLAALAIEYQAELHSNDADFTRFSGLRWRNPLKAK